MIDFIGSDILINWKHDSVPDAFPPDVADGVPSDPRGVGDAAGTERRGHLE